MQEMKIKIVGVAPLCTHNERLADPTHPITRQLKALTKQRNKTDDLLEQIKKVEWHGGLYEHDGRVVLPADNVLATILNGAKRLKKGQDVKAGVYAKEAYFPLKYSGPKDIEALWKDGRFCDYRGVVVNRARVMRARPIFTDWSVDASLWFDPELISDTDLRQAIEIAGERIGLCERRPRLGRFIPEFN